MLVFGAARRGHRTQLTDSHSKLAANKSNIGNNTLLERTHDGIYENKGIRKRINFQLILTVLAKLHSEKKFNNQ